MFRKSVAAAAAAALVASPVVAQVDTVQRTGPTMTRSSAFTDGPVLPPILFATIVVLGILMATGVLFDDDDSTPIIPISP